MSTKSQTSSSNQSTIQYDPASMNVYNALIGGAGKTLQGYIKSPLANPLYRLGLGASMAGASKLGRQNINAFMSNLQTGGFGGKAGNAFKTAELSRIGRSNASMMSQAQIQNIMAAYQRQLQAAGMGLSFNPLLTGETSKGQSTTTKSGLGTWLPQLLGAGIGAASNMFMPGAGGAMGAFGAGSGGAIANQGLSNFNQSMSAVNS